MTASPKPLEILPAPRSKAEYIACEKAPLARAVVTRVLGVEIPMELVHDEHFDIIAAAIVKFGGNWQAAADDIRRQLPREVLVLIRALRLNLARLRAVGGGIYATH